MLRFFAELLREYANDLPLLCSFVELLQKGYYVLPLLRSFVELFREEDDVLPVLPFLQVIVSGLRTGDSCLHYP